MSNDNQVTETDTAFSAMLALLFGSQWLDPKRGKGIQDALSEIRDDFLAREQKKAAAIVEHVRRNCNVNNPHNP